MHLYLVFTLVYKEASYTQNIYLCILKEVFMGTQLWEKQLIFFHIFWCCVRNHCNRFYPLDQVSSTRMIPTDDSGYDNI